MKPSLHFCMCAAWLLACSGEDGDPDAERLPPLTYAPIPGCEHVDHAPCDTREERCLGLRFELAACMRGSEAGELPPVTHMSEQDFIAYLTAEHESEPRPNPDHFERALGVLRLVAPGAFAPAMRAAEDAQHIAGIYRWTTKDIVIVERDQPADDGASNALAVHEFVHALQDRDVDLQRFYEEHASSFDTALALHAVVEGEARFFQLSYGASLHGLDPATFDLSPPIDHIVAEDEAWGLEQSSPYLVARAAFAYGYGARLVAAARKATGRDDVFALFASPPPSTWAVMSGANSENQPGPEIAAPQPPETWTAVTDGALGAWGLLAALSRAAGGGPRRPVALGWRGDHFWVYAGSGPSVATSLVWKIEFREEALAEAALEIFTMGFRDASVRRTGTLVTFAQATPAAVLDWALP